jgi:TRAP transporter TAXI family solute receptor
MRRHAWTVALATSLFLHAGAAQAAIAYTIVTASERGTYIKIGQDLARIVAPSADIELAAVPSAGSVENVRRLRYEPGVKFALVQSDVYQGYLDMAAGGNAEAATLIRPLRVVLPLYNEEIYFVARADSEMNFVHDIRSARINAGEAGSGTALTSSTLYRLMFGVPMPEPATTYLANEEALVKLITDKSVDVVAIVAGQPAKLLVDMKPEARQHVKLLRFDPNAPASKAALKTYFPATVRATSYPNLLSEDLPSLAVKAFLVTYDYRTRHTEDSLRRFARSLCRSLPEMREKGHPKWREVDLSLPELGRGWAYYSPTAQEIRACVAGEAQGGAPQPRWRPSKPCSQQEKLLGLCG